MGIAAGSRGPLNVSEVGTAGHANVSIAPRLVRDPVQRIASIFNFMVIRYPLSGAVFPASDILNDNRVAALNKPVVLFDTVVFSVGSPDQDRRYPEGGSGEAAGGFRPEPVSRRGGKIDVCSQLFAVGRRDHVSTGKMDRADRISRPFF